MKFGEEISGPPFSFSKIFEVEADNVIIRYIYIYLPILMNAASTSKKMEKENRGPLISSPNFNLINIINYNNNKIRF